MPRETVYKPIEKISKITPIKKDFSEYLREIGKFVSKENSATNTTTTIYTIPEGYAFYITSIQLSYLVKTGATSPTANIQINKQYILMLDSSDVADSVDSVVSNPIIPIKMHAGEKIEVQSDDANFQAHGVIGGYQIKASNVLKFLK